MKAAAVFSTLALVCASSAFVGCARAEWQESLGAGPVAQEQAPPQNGKPTAPEIPEPQKFGECKSQTLVVTVDTSQSTVSLGDLKTVLARYPLIRTTLGSKSKAKSVFYMNARDTNKKACIDEACAEKAGWSQLQDDIQSLNDTEISCEGQPLQPGPAGTKPGSVEGLG